MVHLPPMLRWALRGAAVLAALAALAYGLDRGSRAAAETVVSRAIEHNDPAPQEAHVAIPGAFFLPDVVDGRYPHVQVRLDHISQEGLTVQSVDADLYGVHLPLSLVVHQRVTAIPIDDSRERALITYDALNHYLAAQGRPITVSNGTGGDLRLEAHLDTLGRSVSVSADADMTPGVDYLDVTPTRLDTGSGVVDAASSVLLKVRLAFRVTTSPLPFGQQVQSIRATPAGVVVIATGHDVVIFP